MRQSTKHSRPRPPQLPFPLEAHQVDLWQSLPPEQQHACCRLLGQLLYDLSRQERDERQPNERSDQHE
jgi:hypothetical protein